MIMGSKGNYQISSNKLPGAYLNFFFWGGGGGALIRRKTLNWGEGMLIEFILLFFFFVKHLHSPY